MTHDEMIAVITAHKEGKQIQAKLCDRDEAWQDNNWPAWNFCSCDYRVKPDPREWWLVIGNGYKEVASTRGDAERLVRDVYVTAKIVHVREVEEKQ